MRDIWGFFFLLLLLCSVHLCPGLSRPRTYTKGFPAQGRPWLHFPDDPRTTLLNTGWMSSPVSTDLTSRHRSLKHSLLSKQKGLVVLFVFLHFFLLQAVSVDLHVAFCILWMLTFLLILLLFQHTQLLISSLPGNSYFFGFSEGPLSAETFELIGGQLTSMPCSITAFWMAFLVVLTFMPQ